MDQTVDSEIGRGLPVIGYMLREVAEAEEVADYLQMVAGHVRQGHLLGFELKWQLGTEAIEANIYPKVPLNFIKLGLSAEDSQNGNERGTSR